MCMAVNSHDLPVSKKNRIVSLPCIFETTILDSGRFLKQNDQYMW